MSTLSKQLNKFFFFCLVARFSLFVGFAPLPAYAQSQEAVFNSVEIEAYINRDGSFDVVDARTFASESQGNIYTYVLSKTAGSEISEFTTNENSFTYTESSSPIPPTGTYTIKIDDSNKLEVQIGLLNPGKTTNLVFSYHVTNAIEKYADVADLSWDFIPPESYEVVGQVSISINLPDVSEEALFHIWGQGPLTNKITIADGQAALYTTSSLHSPESLSFRAIFESNVILGNTIDKNMFDEISKEEDMLQAAADKLYDQKVRKDNLFKLFLIGYLGVFQAVIICIWILTYRKISRASVRSSSSLSSRAKQGSPPSHRRPATLQVLLQSKDAPDENAYIATLVDLARRGFLKFENEKQVSSGLMEAKVEYEISLKLVKEFSKEKQITAYEKNILQYLREMMNSELSLSLKQMESKWKDDKKKFREHFGDFKKEVIAYKDKEPYWDGELHKIANRFWFFSSLLTLLFLGSPFIPVLGLIFIPKLKQNKLKQEAEKKLWLDFWSFLRDFTRLSHLPPKTAQLWETYLVYAVALRETKQFFSKISSILQDSQNQPDWFTLAGESTFNTAMISSFGPHMQALIDSLDSAMTAALDEPKASK